MVVTGIVLVGVDSVCFLTTAFGPPLVGDLHVACHLAHELFEERCRSLFYLLAR